MVVRFDVRLAAEQARASTWADRYRVTHIVHARRGIAAQRPSHSPTAGGAVLARRLVFGPAARVDGSRGVFPDAGPRRLCAPLATLHGPAAGDASRTGRAIR